MHTTFLTTNLLIVLVCLSLVSSEPCIPDGKTPNSMTKCDCSSTECVGSTTVPQFCVVKASTSGTCLGKPTACVHMDGKTSNALTEKQECQCGIGKTDRCTAGKPFCKSDGTCVVTAKVAAEQEAEKKESSRLEKVKAAARKVAAETSEVTVLLLLFGVLVLFACCLYATSHVDKKKTNADASVGHNKEPGHTRTRTDTAIRGHLRGSCVICGEPVLSSQSRGSDDAGRYYHLECFDKQQEQNCDLEQPKTGGVAMTSANPMKKKNQTMALGTVPDLGE